MKILIDARLYGLENAGLGRYINNLIDNLASIDSKNQYVILLRKKYFEELNLPSNWKKVLADFRHYSLKEQLILPFLISSNNPDLVHFPHFNVPLFYSGRYVVTIHDTLMHEQRGLEATTLAAPIYFIKRLGYHLVFKAAVYKSKKIIAPSMAVRTDLIERYKVTPNKILVTYEGVDKRIAQRRSLDMKRPYFLYVGNAYPHKNLARLIEAIMLLNTKYNQKAILAIASARNVFTHKLEQLINKFNAKEYVKMLGFVKDEELGGLMKNSSAFIFPSLIEGFGLPGLEAMSVGTLVLASDIPVFHEVYQDNAMFFDPIDLGSMVGTMTKALSMTSSQREKMIKLGQKFVNKYSWEKMAQETLDIYKESVK